MVTDEDAGAVRIRADYSCEGCGQYLGLDGGSIHHAIYKSQGGPDTLWNLTLACDEQDSGTQSCHYQIHKGGNKALRYKLQDLAMCRKAEGAPADGASYLPAFPKPQGRSRDKNDKRNALARAKYHWLVQRFIAQLGVAPWIADYQEKKAYRERLEQKALAERLEEEKAAQARMEDEAA